MKSIRFAVLAAFVLCAVATKPAHAVGIPAPSGPCVGGFQQHYEWQWSINVGFVKVATYTTGCAS